MFYAWPFFFNNFSTVQTFQVESSPPLATMQPSHRVCAVNNLEHSFLTYWGGTDAQDKAVNGRKADSYEVHEEKQNGDKGCAPHYSEWVGVGHSFCCRTRAPLRLHFVFRLLQRGIKKGLMDARQESSLILSVVSKGSWGHGGGFFSKLGSWGKAESGKRSIYITGQFTLFSLHLYGIFLSNWKCHTPVGSCAEANLVSRIPAPSIKANRMPPMAAEPTIATGPSEEKRDWMEEIGGWLTLLLAQTPLCEIRLIILLTSGSKNGTCHGSTGDRVPGIFLASHFDQTTVNHGEQPSPYCKTSWHTHTHIYIRTRFPPS